MKLANINFKASTRWSYKDGKTYYTSVAGTREDKLSIRKNVGTYKIHSEHFNCALPYNRYYVIDTITGIVWESEDCHFNEYDKIVKALEALTNN